MNASTPPQHHPRRVLVTGGAGFIGSNLVRHLLGSDPSLYVVNYDLLTYAGSLTNLEGIEDTHKDRYTFVRADICDEEVLRSTLQSHEIDTIIHLAADSHVDRSISGPRASLETNVIGTYALLQGAREAWKDRKDVRFHHVSTDEVYGSLGATGFFTESTAYDPSSPYSASKAASDHLVRAWGRTFGIPYTLSNCSNNYGPYQFPEKLIPLMIAKALAGEPLPVYGDGSNVRDWLHVADHCRAIDLIVRRAQNGRTYNVGGHNEMKNLELVHMLADELQRLRPRASGHYRDLITFVRDRPGHDHRYAIDAGLIDRDLGWQPQYDFGGGLRHTIEWYLANQAWAERIRGERYAGERLG